MRKILISIFILTQVALYATPKVRPANWGIQIIGAKVGNFYKVSETLYRSEQPKKDEIDDYKAFGIKTVINLRQFHSDKSHFKDSDVTLVEIPLNLLKLREKRVKKALKAYHFAQKPVVIHCQHGSDRTGLIIALYRIIYENWSKKEAIDELTNGGYGYHSMFKKVIKFIEVLDIDAYKTTF